MCENLTHCVKFSPKAAEFDLKSQISAAVVRSRVLDPAPTQLHRSSHTLVAAGQRLNAAPTNLQLPQNLTAAAGAASICSSHGEPPAQLLAGQTQLLDAAPMQLLHPGIYPRWTYARRRQWRRRNRTGVRPKIERMFGGVFAEVVFSE